MNDSARQQLIGELEERFKPFTDELYKELLAKEFYFEEQTSSHRSHLDAKLITRHTLPYCITEERYFSLQNQDVGFLASVILLHSLALTRIDDYYDGGHKTKRSRPLNVDALAYSLSATHQAMLDLLKQAPNVPELAKLLDVTAFVHARMYKDYSERYRTEYLDSPQRRLQFYLHSPRSRLFGSGYWEVMARASFVQRGKNFPAYLQSIDHKLRKFRQMIDELADIREDLAGGLVTLPVLHALTHHKQPNLVRAAVTGHWAGRTLALAPLLEECGTHKWVYKQANALYQSAMTELDRTLGNRGDGYRRLFEYKKAKLDQLIEEYN